MPLAVCLLLLERMLDFFLLSFYFRDWLNYRLPSIFTNSLGVAFKLGYLDPLANRLN